MNDGGNPASGNFDLQFTPYDALSAGNPVGSTVQVVGVAVSGGLFQVSLDFGATAFNGGARWLEIGVRSNGTFSAYTTLLPRQSITATPYAIQAGMAATVPVGSIDGSRLAANSITAANIANGTITTLKLADGSVNMAKLDASVQTNLAGHPSGSMVLSDNPNATNLLAAGFLKRDDLDVVRQAWQSTVASNYLDIGGFNGESAFWTGDAVLLWGAGTGGFYRGATYKPITKWWTAISTNSAPSYRNQAVCWTGTELMVWGGNYFTNGTDVYANTGARYSPTSNSWTTLPTNNAPTGRALAKSVWTGSELIVWGGAVFNGGWQYTNTGSRLIFAANSWSGMSTNGALTPSDTPRGSFMCWTGSEVLVANWNSSIESFSGGKYSPPQNLWTPFSTNNAPTGMQAVAWSGTELIVLDQRGFVKYDPSSNTWHRSAPFVEAYGGVIGTVWTGNEMWIMSNEKNLTRYNPLTEKINVVLVSDSGYDNSFIWTGSDIISVPVSGTSVIKKLTLTPSLYFYQKQ